MDCDILVNAIRTMNLVELVYEPGNRTIEPYVIGYGSSGQMLLRAFQIGGASESGEHANWKLFRVDRIERAVILPGHFVGMRPEYNPDDRVMKGGIIARVRRC